MASASAGAFSFSFSPEQAKKKDAVIINQDVKSKSSGSITSSGLFPPSPVSVTDSGYLSGDEKSQEELKAEEADSLESPKSEKDTGYLSGDEKELGQRSSPASLADSRIESSAFSSGTTSSFTLPDSFSLYSESPDATFKFSPRASPLLGKRNSGGEDESGENEREKEDPEEKKALSSHDEVTAVVGEVLEDLGDNISPEEAKAAEQETQEDTKNSEDEERAEGVQEEVEGVEKDEAKHADEGEGTTDERSPPMGRHREDERDDGSVRYYISY